MSDFASVETDNGQSNVVINQTNRKKQPVGMNYECTKCASCPSIGSFNRKSYDNCAYALDLNQSVSPLNYVMSRFQYENCSACTFDGKYYAPFDLVDQESELLNITRPDSKCNSMKYSPTCAKSDMCTSTFDKSNPSVAIRNICPVVCNNIQKMKTPGYTLNQSKYCGNKQQASVRQAPVQGQAAPMSRMEQEIMMRQ